MYILCGAKRILAAALSGMVGTWLLGCNMSAIDPMQSYQPVKPTLPPPLITATYFTPTITLSPTPTSTPTATQVPPTSTPTATITLTPTHTPTATATRRPLAPTALSKVDLTPEQIPVSLPSHMPDSSPTLEPGPASTPYIVPIPTDPGRLPILTMGACNTVERGYIWGQPNVATRPGFEATTLMMTDWAPTECKPDASNPIRPSRSLTVAECAVYYFKPAVLVLFPTRSFGGHAYYDDVASLIIHIENYEREIGLERSKKVVIGPVSYDGGVIGSPNAVLVLGANAVNLPDIIVKTRETTGLMAASDNVHLVASPYFFGILNSVVLKAVAGTNSVYTIEAFEIPPYAP